MHIDNILKWQSWSACLCFIYSTHIVCNCPNRPVTEDETEGLVAWTNKLEDDGAEVELAVCPKLRPATDPCPPKSPDDVLDEGWLKMNPVANDVGFAEFVCPRLNPADDVGLVGFALNPVEDERLVWPKLKLPADDCVFPPGAKLNPVDDVVGFVCPKLKPLVDVGFVCPRLNPLDEVGFVWPKLNPPEVFTWGAVEGGGNVNLVYTVLLYLNKSFNYIFKLFILLQNKKKTPFICKKKKYFYNC